MRIAIQGGPASFHDVLTRTIFEETSLEVLHCDTFEQVGQLLADGSAARAVMAVENTLAGPLLNNFKLVQQHQFHILEEHWLPIDQTLMALPGQTLQNLQEVWSHPVALQQCSRLFEQHPYLVATAKADTADSARQIQEQQLKGIGAIASLAAAALYDLTVLQAQAADTRHNYTRFFLLSKERRGAHVPATKASLIVPILSVNSSAALVSQLKKILGKKLSLCQELPGGKNPELLVEVSCPNEKELIFALKKLKSLEPRVQLLGMYQGKPAPQLSSILDSAL
ncbi:prephenate dehydratase [Nibribacter ruber]|uniref:prephenate dehydratase n=1 Tax=Nibribacter ruber TaxID=2698458 RepID=A0A6P1P0R0_9BACT|nr:prephenate dehydratase domain-containing protein [Nibribacter ruber]QHL86602.1 prephenate dehydratase [Nibribacter ruber]